MEQATSVAILSEKIALLMQVAITIEEQIYQIQAKLFGRCKEKNPSKGEDIPQPSGLLLQWNSEIGSALQNLRIAQGDIMHMMDELNIKEVK